MHVATGVDGITVKILIACKSWNTLEMDATLPSFASNVLAAHFDGGLLLTHTNLSLPGAHLTGALASDSLGINILQQPPLLFSL